MWWVFFILFILISIISSVLLFYALRRITQYEELLLQIQDIIEHSDNQLKIIDSKGTFESDDEVGFFFESVKELQKILNDFKITRLK